MWVTGLLLLLVVTARALVSELELEGDTRGLVLIEDFGAAAGAVWNLTVFNFTHEGDGACGFLVDFSSTESSTVMTTSAIACSFLDGTTDIASVGFLVKPPFTASASHVVAEGREGFYHTNFVSCSKDAGAKTSFKLTLAQYNVDASSGKRHYLAVGDHATIALNAVCCGIYALAIAAWSVVLWRNREGRHLVHHAMTLLLVLKLLSFAFSSIQLAYQDVHGTRGGWAVPYFGFLIIKGTFLFILVILLGSGWSIVKPYLSAREKTVVAVVLSLQIIDNVALVYVEGAEQGSADWTTWQNVFRVFDLVCCCAILFPVLWSIQHLKQASKTDGKAAVSLKKLSIFREFYLIVIVYVYFRVILLYLLSMSLTYKLSWISFTAEEAVTAALICIVGYKFRPAKDNPYLKVDDDEDDIEMPSSVATTTSTTTSSTTATVTSRSTTTVDEDKIEMASIP